MRARCLASVIMMVIIHDCAQSVTGSATPGDASKGEISDIKAELRKLLDDMANDDMGYAGQYMDTNHMR